MEGSVNITAAEATEMLQAEIEVLESMIAYNRDFDPEKDNESLLKKLTVFRMVKEAVEKQLPTADKVEADHSNGCAIKTNAEKIREMTDEELVDFLADFDPCGHCENAETTLCTDKDCETVGRECLTKWLQKEAN